MRKNNKGFSLIEIIIVVAIMAVLIGVLAPQYMKYVKESKISYDINNADEIANATGVALADPNIPLALPAPGTTITVTAADLPNVSAFPQSKMNASYTWVVTVGANGVDNITLGTYEIWPDPDDATNGYRTQHN